MLWLTVVFALLISLAAVAYVAWPLLNPASPPVLVEDDQLTELIARKDSVLTAIKELEFDYQVGKMSEEDYERFNLRLRRQAIAYIQQIERLAPQSQEVDQALEAEIADMRKTQQPSASPNGAGADAPSAAAPPSDDDRSVYCTNCGKPIAADHNFCAHCGAAVRSADRAASG